MRRVISLWLPTFATDRLRRQRTGPRRPEPGTFSPGTPPKTSATAASRSTAARPSLDKAPGPLATVATAQGGVRIVAVNTVAAAAGVAPGLPLAAARAVLPNLAVAAADPAGDRAALDTLADWCGRYTPWTAADPAGLGGSPSVGSYGGDAGIWLDVSGCAHLFGGEAALLADLTNRLAGFGLAAAAAVADTPGAAWAVARFGRARTARTARGDGTARTEPGDVAGGMAPENGAGVVAPGETEGALAPLPVAGLRLSPTTVADLDLVGLRRIGELAALPRAPLAARFGDTVPRQLDRALGRADEPISPRRPVPAFRARLAFAEPIGRPEDIAATTVRLLADLCGRLEAARRGARRLELALFRTDGTVARAAVGTGRPVRDADHLARLFREKLDGTDPGYGIETAILAATVVDPLAAVQTTLATDGRAPPGEDLARLLDRLGNRLHPANVVRLAPRQSHLPERACRPVPAATVPAATVPASAPAGAPTAEDHRSRQPRPPTLLPTPEPVEVVAPVPDGPPVLLQRGRARHRIVAAKGPERIGPEWWLDDDGLAPDRLARSRDYYRLEDETGRRFWVFREGSYRAYAPPRWYLHGLFG